MSRVKRNKSKVTSLMLTVVMIVMSLSGTIVTAGTHDQDLLTIQNSVDTRMQQFIDHYYNIGVQPETNPNGVLSYTLAALMKNQDLANANQELIDMLAITTWDNTLSKSQSIYFEIPNLIRIWYLFNQNSTEYPGRLTTAAETAIKQWFYDHANTRSHYSDTDLSQLWHIIDSENHDIIKRSTAFFMTNALKDDPNYKNLTLQDGYTLEQHADGWENYFSYWFNERARRGTLIEMASPQYLKYSLPYIYTMRDFGPNQQIRNHADMFITLIFADYAQEYNDGARGGGKARVYIDEKYNVYGIMEATYEYSHLYYNLGELQNIEKNGGGYTSWSAVTSDYRVPLEVMDLALYPESKGSYEYTSTRPAYDPTYTYNVAFPSYLRRYSYVTPGYILGGFTVDKTSSYIKLNEQNRWMGALFTGRKDTRAFLTTTGLSHGGVSAYNNLNSIGDGNALILQKPDIASYDSTSKIFISQDMYDVRSEDSGWIFTYDPKGSGYLAIKPASGVISSWTDVIWNRNPVGTYVSNGASSDLNFSSSTDLRVKNRSGDGSISYLNIGHPGDIEVESSKLRLYANAISGTPVVKVYGLTDDNWDRETMTWNSGSPNHSLLDYSVTGEGTSATLITSKVISSASEYYEFDVTDYVNSQIASGTWHKGDSTISFMLVGQNDDGSHVIFNSTKALANRPELESITGKYGNLSDEHSPVVFQTALSNDYVDFAEFRSDVLNNTFRWNSSTEFEYQGTGSGNLKYYTNDTLPKIDDVTVDLTPSKTYDSPYLSADYNSPVVTITNTSNETLTLDFTIQGYPSEEQASNIGWWELNETSGTTASDSVASGDGTVNGATWTNGAFDNALNFDGIDDYVELPSVNGISSTKGSVSLWVNSDHDYTTQGMMFYGAGETNGNGFGTHDELHLHFNADESIGFFIQGDSQGVSLNSATSYADGQWHHVAATWDIDGSAILYVDGLQVGSVSHDANTFDFSTIMRMGTTAQNGVRNYEGLLDQVKIYDGALSAEAIAILAGEDPAAPPAPTPVVPDGHWNMNEISGTTANDVSINNYDGVVNGAAWTSGYMNNALSFDGVDDYVELPKTTNMSSSQGTISMWVNSSHDYTDHGMMFYGAFDTIGNGYGSHRELHLNYRSDETIAFFIEGGSQDVSIASTNSYADGQWHHVAATWDISGDAKLYIDGTEVASVTHDATAFDFSGVMRFGQTAGNTRYYKGLMDQVKMYNIALDAAQIQLLANEQ